MPPKFRSKKIKAGDIAYRIKNKDTIAEKNRVYYQANREVLLEKRREYTRLYAEKYRQVNRDKCLAYNREYHKTYDQLSTPSHQPPQRAAREGLRRARKRGQTAELSIYDHRIINALYTLRSLCSSTFGELYHVDHIHPIAKGGSHHPDNLQVITAAENLTKHTKFLSNEVNFG